MTAIQKRTPHRINHGQMAAEFPSDDVEAFVHSGEGTADLVIAFEPAEAARVLPFLAPDGLLVTATTAIQPVTAALSDKPYRADDVLENIERSLAGTGARFVAVDDVALTDAVGNRKVLNSVLLASALKEGRIALDLDDLRRALEECVKPDRKSVV